MEQNKIAKLASKLMIDIIKTDLPNKEINRLNDILADIRDEAINYTRCSLQLNHDDLEIGQQVSITQTKLVEINCFREDGDIDVEDTNSVFTVSRNEISKVV